MIRATRTRVLSGTAVLAAAVLAGCSSMLATYPHNWAESPEQKACSAGVYHLPRKLFHIRVNVTASPTLEFDTAANVKSFADGKYPLCLDYLAAPTADDTIAIKRTPDGLLQKIHANADDKSLEIATAVIDIARLSAVAAGSAGPARSLLSKEGANFYAGPFQMDPFDPTGAASINDRLKDLGFCIYVEGYSFDPARLKPEAYCRNPRLAGKHAPRGFAVDPAVVLAESSRGVLYRPNETHRAVVMERRANGEWYRSRTHAVEMPNVAPIFSVGVDRTFFAKRKTVLIFDDGVLQNVELEKGSELNAIAEIPLKILQAVFSVPAQVVQVRINRVNNQRALINAQAELIKAQRDFKAEQKAVVDDTKKLVEKLADDRNKAKQECLQERPELINDSNGLETCIAQKMS